MDSMCSIALCARNVKKIKGAATKILTLMVRVNESLKRLDLDEMQWSPFHTQQNRKALVRVY